MKKFITLVLCLFYLFSLIGQGRFLNIGLVKQLKSKWCWAACTEMVDGFYNPTGRSQCYVVQNYLQSINILDPLNPNDIVNCDDFFCTSPGGGAPFFNNLLRYTNIYNGYSRVLSNLGYYSSVEFFPNNPSWDNIKKEIDNCRPLVLFVAQAPEVNPDINNPGHVMVIYGYETVGEINYLLVRDPWNSSHSSCTPCSSTKINFTNITANPCILRLSGYQMNICLKAETFCLPCPTERSPIDFVSDTIPLIRSFEEPIVISVKMLNLKTSTTKNIYYPNELFDKYYPSKGETHSYEIINKTPLEVEVKKCSYPESLNVNYRGQIITVGNKETPNIPQYSIIRAPYPYTENYYSFIDSTTKKTLFFSTTPVYDPLNPNKILFQANEAYSEQAFQKRVECYKKKTFKVPTIDDLFPYVFKQLSVN